LLACSFVGLVGGEGEGEGEGHEWREWGSAIRGNRRELKSSNRSVVPSFTSSFRRAVVSQLRMSLAKRILGWNGRGSFLFFLSFFEKIERQLGTWK
jgi:hypothetical protein